MGPERADGSGVGWADALRERLFEQRTVLVRGELTDVLASETGAALMTLDALGAAMGRNADATKPLYDYLEHPSMYRPSEFVALYQKAVM